MRQPDDTVHEVERNGELGCVIDRLMGATSILAATFEGIVNGAGAGNLVSLDGTRSALGRVVKLAREAQRLQSGEPRAYSREIQGAEWQSAHDRGGGR